VCEIKDLGRSEKAPWPNGCLLSKTGTWGPCLIVPTACVANYDGDNDSDGASCEDPAAMQRGGGEEEEEEEEEQHHQEVLAARTMS